MNNKTRYAGHLKRDNANIELHSVFNNRNLQLGLRISVRKHLKSLK